MASPQSRLQAAVTELFHFDLQHLGRLALFNLHVYSSKELSLPCFQAIASSSELCSVCAFMVIERQGWWPVLPPGGSVVYKRSFSMVSFNVLQRNCPFKRSLIEMVNFKICTAFVLECEAKFNMQRNLLPYCKYGPPQSLSSHSDTLK